MHHVRERMEEVAKMSRVAEKVIKALESGDVNTSDVYIKRGVYECANGMGRASVSSPHTPNPPPLT